ncbi:hypothetical protein J4Q44_G00162670 [Coregonus suidteri]|uniref:Uncharacterized protein n=1 Tax=Coregonus suidteri TaxID=861788 RepID=A0AAN8QQT8_9TELE
MKHHSADDGMHVAFNICDVKGEVAFTIFNCRFNKDLLRRFCNAAGYGWDYPDIEFRDIPLCYPETLCLRMLDILISDEKFRLSPLGLVRVRQSLRTWQPIDELKKGPFMLQARVLEYRVVEDGVEVDISLTAISRTDQPVWESVLTMLSQDRGRTPSTQPIPEWYDGHLDTSESDDIMKAVDINVPWTTGLKSVWAFSDYSPHCLLTIPAKLSGYRCTQTPGLWMLSKCLAEIEKHKGVDAIRAPISVTAQFKEPLLVAGKVTIKFLQCTSEKCMKKQRKSKTSTIHLSSPVAEGQRKLDGSSLTVYGDGQKVKVVYEVYPGDVRTMENGAHSQRRGLCKVTSRVYIPNLESI